MMRVNMVLLMAVVLSAVYLVSVQYDSRRLFTELDRTTNESRRLETEYERLQVEKRAQATPARVEKLAREKLQMRQVSPAITAYVNYSAPSTAPIVPAAPAVGAPAKGAALQGGNP